MAKSWQDLSAIYEVPAAKELSDFAKCQMTDLRRRSRDGVVEIQYTIPTELAGGTVAVHTRSIDGGKTFVGPISNMICTGNDCEVRTPGLNVKLSEVVSYLKIKRNAGARAFDAAKGRLVFSWWRPSWYFSYPALKIAG